MLTRGGVGRTLDRGGAVLNLGGAMLATLLGTIQRQRREVRGYLPPQPVDEFLEAGTSRFVIDLQGPAQGKLQAQGLEYRQENLIGDAGPIPEEVARRPIEETLDNLRHFGRNVLKRHAFAQPDEDVIRKNVQERDNEKDNQPPNLSGAESLLVVKGTSTEDHYLNKRHEELTHAGDGFTHQRRLRVCPLGQSDDEVHTVPPIGNGRSYGHHHPHQDENDVTRLKPGFPPRIRIHANLLTNVLQVTTQIVEFLKTQLFAL